MSICDTVWAHQVATATDLPDPRLNQWLAAILEDEAGNPDASIPEAAGEWGQARATYRSFANPRVMAAASRHGIALDTARRCLDQEVVLGVPDTTTLNFTGLHRIPEPGPIDSGGWCRV
jgi:hypothetical protein